MAKSELIGTHLDSPNLRVDFFTPFKVSPSVLLATRILGLLSATSWLLMREFIPAGPMPGYCYLTIWGVFAAAVYYWVVVALSIFPNQKGFTVSTLTPFYKFLHVLFQLCVGMLFVICLMFWGFLVPSMKALLARHPDHAHLILWYNIGTHLIVPFQMWLESYINNVGYRTKDAVIWLPTVACVYTCLNYYWTQSYGRPVYAPMDWKSVSTPIFMIAAYSLAGFGFYLAKRLWLWKMGGSGKVEKKKE